jgi:polysaccharide pyruvyl transferase WcaK-like protein
MITVNKTVTWGNIITWVTVIIAMTVSWTRMEKSTEQNSKDVSAALVIAKKVEESWARLEGNTIQNAKDVAAALLMAQKVEDSQRAIDARRDAQINSLTVAMAVTEVTVKSIDKKLDELISRRPRE